MCMLGTRAYLDAGVVVTKKEGTKRNRKRENEERRGARERGTRGTMYSAGTCTRLKRFAAEETFRRAARWFIKAEPAVVIRI